jgi:hypothetical protein
MVDKARRALKDKYSLVHIPNRHRIRDWEEQVIERVKDGVGLEDAGTAAAREVFRYEFKPHRVADSTPVKEILAYLKQH